MMRESLVLLLLENYLKKGIYLLQRIFIAISKSGWRVCHDHLEDVAIVNDVFLKDDVFSQDEVSRHSLLLKTENGFIYTNDGFHPCHAEGPVAKKAIEGYPHIIKLDAGRSRNVFVLANDKREVVKLEVVKTSDRGYTTNLI